MAEIQFPLPTASPWTNPDTGQTWIHNGKNWVRKAADPGIEEAPVDGQQYVRANADWVINNPDMWYLGPQATPPFIDNYGNAIQEGHVYYNTVTNETLIWDGSSWGLFSPVYAINTVQEYVWDSHAEIAIDGSPTFPDEYGNFPANWVNGQTYLAVFVDGVRQINEISSADVAGDYIIDYVNNTIVVKNAVIPANSRIVIQEAKIVDVDGIQVTDNNASGFGFVIDEDDMISDLDTHLPTQQSVKAYVDNTIAASIANIAGGLIDSSKTIGLVFDYAGTVAPAGALVCDGSLKLIADYPLLYAAIGDTWANFNGAENPTSEYFRLPPQVVVTAEGTFGLYRRGMNATTEVGQYKSSQNKRHSHAHDHGHNATVSSAGNHSHTTHFTTRSIASGANGRCMASDNGGTTGADATRGSNSTGGHTHSISLSTTDINTSNQGELEARPESAVYMTCIWADAQVAG